MDAKNSMYNPLTIIDSGDTHWKWSRGIKKSQFGHSPTATARERTLGQLHEPPD